MTKPQISVYADTSVYGGVFDEDFAEASQAFFDLVRNEVYTLCVSEVVHQELSVAPEKVNFFKNFFPQLNCSTLDTMRLSCNGHIL